MGKAGSRSFSLMEEQGHPALVILVGILHLQSRDCQEVAIPDDHPNLHLKFTPGALGLHEKDQRTPSKVCVRGGASAVMSTHRFVTRPLPLYIIIISIIPSQIHSLIFMPMPSLKVDAMVTEITGGSHFI